MKKILLFTLLSLILLFSGCAFVKKKTGTAQDIGSIEGTVGQTEQQLPTSGPSVDDQQSAKEIEYLTLPSYERRQGGPLPELESIDPKELVLEEGPVMVNVEGMPLSDFITYAIGNTLKVTYFIDEAVKAMKTPVTLRMSKKMSAETVFEIVIDILRQHALIVEQRGGSLYVLKSRPAATAPLDMRFGRSVPESGARIAQLVFLRHTRPNDIIRLVSGLYQSGVSMQNYTDGNAILLVGTAASIKTIISFVEMLDVPYFNEKKLLMIQLVYWQPDEFIGQIKTILQNIGFQFARGPKDPGILLIPIKFLNSVLAILPDENTMEIVIEWKDRLDTPESAGTKEKPFTYKPKYKKASDLVDAIKELHGVFSNGKENTSKGAIPGLKIGADDGSNLVVLMATPSAYKSILSLLMELDTPPRQVLLEATVAELTLTDNLQYGLEWYLANSYDGGPFSFESLGGIGSIGAAGLVLDHTTETGTFDTIMSAFASEDKIKILSRPKLMVLDNESATINIGTDVPVITSEVPDASVTVTGENTSTNITRTIQYRSTGLTLNVTPTINTEETITLEISISMDEAQTNSFGSLDNPMILTRSINTTVAVSSGQSIILGGLMRENKSDTVSKIPLLGDIPFLGNLFKATSTSTVKTEMIIMITPTILTDTNDAARLTDELKKELKWLK